MICPISREPVANAAVIEDGTTDERSSIANGLKGGTRTSPMTRAFPTSLEIG